jgi:CheY-like chemotaxis protein
MPHLRAAPSDAPGARKRHFGNHTPESNGLFRAAGHTAPGTAEIDSVDEFRPIQPYALVVDDDPVFARAAAGLLTELGYTVRISPDGHTALLSITENKPDLILLDICLPEMDGVSVMRVVKRLRRAKVTPVIVCSSVYPADSEAAETLRGLGAVAFLCKPFDLATLRGALASIERTEELPGRPVSS